MKLVFFDMDGVLTPKPHPIQLAEMSGRKEAFDNIFRRIISVRNVKLEWVIKEVVKVFAGIPESLLEEAGTTLPVMKGAVETVEQLKKEGYRPILVTNGFEQVAGAFARRIGITEWYGNTFEIKEGKTTGRLQSSPLMTLHSKGYLVRERVQDTSSQKESVAVGNDMNDFAMFGEVGFSVLFNPSSHSKEHLGGYLNIDRELSVKEFGDISRNVHAVIEEPDLNLLLPYLVPEIGGLPKLSGLRTLNSFEMRKVPQATALTR